MFEWLMIHLVTFQTIIVNSTTPCFQNYTSPNLWKECHLDKDFIQGAIIGWQWITGGYFSMVLIAILTAFTYIKYHKLVYPLLVGVLYLPISYFLFPASFLNYAILMAAIGLGIIMWYIVISQTNEQ